MSDFGRRFLLDPERFPGDGDAAPFGDERLGLRIAGHALDVHGLSRAQAIDIGSMWRDFRAPAPNGGAIPISVRRAEVSAFRDVDRRGWSYELDFDHGEEATRLAGLDLVARLDWEPLGGTLWASAEAPDAFRGAFENFVRVLLAHLALARGGVLLHSSAVLDAGGARLFLGPSGAGKSTVARLALDSGREVASDDLNPVVLEEGRFRACGSPFLGDFGARTDGAHPLRAIYRLEKGERDALRPMGRAESIASLVACAPFVNRSPHLSERLLDNVAELTAAVPSFVLTFRREGSFWPILGERDG